MIRSARPGDVAALVALDAVLFGLDAWSAGSFGPPAHTIVASGEGAGEAALDGYAVLALAGDVVDLQRIGVRRECRRAGLATALLDAGLAWAREQGVGRMLLEVGDANAGARDFYAAAGFVGIDRRRGYYRDGTDALVLERAVTR